MNMNNQALKSGSRPISTSIQYGHITFLTYLTMKQKRILS